MATVTTLSPGTLVLGIFAEVLLLDLDARTISTARQTCHYTRNSVNGSYKLSRRIALYEDLYKRTKLTAKSLHQLLLSMFVKELLIFRQVYPVYRDCIDMSPELQKRVGRIPCIPIPRALGTEMNSLFEMALASYGYEASMRRDDDRRFILAITYDLRPWPERYSPSLRERVDATEFLSTGPKPVTVKLYRPGSLVDFHLQTREANFGDVMKGMERRGMYRKE